MFERVYLSQTAKGEEQKAERMLTAMYEYFIKNADKLPQTYFQLTEQYGAEQAVCDYLSSMTDRYALYTFNSLFVPRGWQFIDEE